MYIADRYNNRVRKVTVSTGIITTIAGTGTYSYSGDGGFASSSTIKSPQGVAVDSAGTALVFLSLVLLYYRLNFYSLLGNVYIADTSNNCIRKITMPTEIISTFAGTGTGSYGGDGFEATSATLQGPASVAIDSSGTFR